MKPSARVRNTLLKSIQGPCVLVWVCLFMRCLGSAKKCLSSTVPSAVTMATPTGFSSCAALKNVRLTYNSVSPMRAAGPQCSSAAKTSPRHKSGAGLTPYVPPLHKPQCCSFYRTDFLEFVLSQRFLLATSPVKHTHSETSQTDSLALMLDLLWKILANHHWF